MTPRSYHRKDANHDLVRKTVEAHGWLWEDTAQTALGYDALVTSPGGERTVRLELKDGSLSPSRQKLTPHEEATHEKLARYGVAVELIRCVEDLEILFRPTREGSYDSRQIGGA